MTTALQGTVWGSVQFHYPGVTDRTMEAAYPEIIRFSSEADARLCDAPCSDKNRRRP